MAIKVIKKINNFTLICPLKLKSPIESSILAPWRSAKLAFKRAIIPKGQSYSDDLGLKIVSVNKVIDAIVAAILSQVGSPELPQLPNKEED